jgi:hypothetical protein
MKIRVDSERIVKALRKLAGIEVVLENADDAKEALDLILEKGNLWEQEGYDALKEIKVSSLQKYETSAVDYKLIFMMEFVFEEEASNESKVAAIQALQELLEKA